MLSRGLVRLLGGGTARDGMRASWQDERSRGFRVRYLDRLDDHHHLISTLIASAESLM